MQRDRDESLDDAALIRDMDDWHEQSCRAQRHLLSGIAEADRRELWRGAGAHDMAHWLWMRYGISDWKARRWIDTERALETLPATAIAFARGRLGIDKVVELTRLATADNEADLLPWVERVSSGAIRARADRESRRSREDAAELELARSLVWWHENEGRVFCLSASLPAAAGAIVAKALDRMAERVPVMAGEETASSTSDARRADALVALCSARVAGDPDPDRATVVVHMPVSALSGDSGTGAIEPGCAIEGGGVMHAETARRLACTARLETVIEDVHGGVVGLGRTSREPSAQMMRALRHRDEGCQFPGCGSRRYTHAHHIRWWSAGGSTDMENLALVCSFHHKLPHEHGWSLVRRGDGRVRWYRPDGRRHRVGPAPPGKAAMPPARRPGRRLVLTT
jgi:Domain of unknown function (DUF222)/HNH endonuclease